MIRGLVSGDPVSGGRRHLEIELIINGQQSDQSCLCNGTSIKTLSNEVTKFWVYGHIQLPRSVGWHTPIPQGQKHLKLSGPHPMWLASSGYFSVSFIVSQ